MLRANRPILYACLATCACLAWQAALVHVLYQGNWTALFRAGYPTSSPAWLVERTYYWESAGYDGQFYRLAAYDPLLRGGSVCCMDAPALRYRRILVPALAWLLAFGRSGLIDFTYIAVIAASVLAGVWWLGRYAVVQGKHAAWGLVFLFMPATLVSVQRLTVDVALLAACAAFLYYSQGTVDPRPAGIVKLMLVLIAAGLIRETGLLLIAAACISVMWQKQWRRLPLLAASALPAGLWYAYVALRVPAVYGQPGALMEVPPWLFRQPLVGIARRIADPVDYGYSGIKALVTVGLDRAALGGVLLALVLVLMWRPWIPPSSSFAAALAFAGLVVSVSTPGFWVDVNGWTRPISPLYFFLAVRAITASSWRDGLPALLADLRLSLSLFGELLLAVQKLAAR